jgi:hypothetical protein
VTHEFRATPFEAADLPVELQLQNPINAPDQPSMRPGKEAASSKGLQRSWEMALRNRLVTLRKPVTRKSRWKTVRCRPGPAAAGRLPDQLELVRIIKLRA